MLLCPGPIPKTAHGLPHLVLMHALPSGDRGYAPKFIADSSLPVRVPICAGAVLLSLCGNPFPGVPPRPLWTAAMRYSPALHTLGELYKTLTTQQVCP
jgi:hypothetical protein